MPLARYGLRPLLLRRRAGRPQLKRDPLDSRVRRASMKILRPLLAAAVASGHAIGCSRPGNATSQQHGSHAWLQLYIDADYRVSLDTADMTPMAQGAYLVWYETKHTSPKVEAGKPWNREIIRSLLRCDPLSFKTVRITVHYNDGPVVAAIGGDIADVASKPWKPVVSPSVDEATMRPACAFIAQRSARSR